MKATKGIALLLQFDKLYDRIDLQRPTAHLFAVVAVLWWASFDFLSGYEFAARLLAIVIFSVVVRLLLSRLGASRLSAIVVLGVVLVVIRWFTPQVVMSLNIVGLTLLFSQEFFLLKTKIAALAVGAGMGILSAAAGLNESKVLFIFLTALVARWLWYAVIERMGRKAFVLFTIKIIVMTLILFTIALGLSKVSAPEIGIDVTVPPISVPIWLRAIGIAVLLRGLWTTLLLKTDRSPKERGLRIFYLFFGGTLMLVMICMQRVGEQIFLPKALEVAFNMGVLSYNVAIMAYLLLATGLFFTAGIDRSLYKDTTTVRYLRKKLATLSE